MNKFHRGGNRSQHEEMEAICGGNRDVMMCFDYVWNDMKLGAKPERSAQSLAGQPFMHEWDEMMSCLAACEDPGCKRLLDFCFDVESMLY